MKRLKRLTALIIAFALTVSVLSFATAVSAESEIESYVVKSEDTELAYKLEKLGVITNEFEEENI